MVQIPPQLYLSNLFIYIYIVHKIKGEIHNSKETFQEKLFVFLVFVCILENVMENLFWCLALIKKHKFSNFSFI